MKIKFDLNESIYKRNGVFVIKHTFDLETVFSVSVSLISGAIRCLLLKGKSVDIKYDK